VSIAVPADSSLALMDLQEVICARMVRHMASVVSLAVNPPPAARYDIERLCSLPGVGEAARGLVQRHVREFAEQFSVHAARVRLLISLIGTAELQGDYVRKAVHDLGRLERALRLMERAGTPGHVRRVCHSASSIADGIHDEAGALLTGTMLPSQTGTLQEGERAPVGVSSLGHSPEAAGPTVFTVLLLSDLHWRVGKLHTGWADVERPLLDDLAAVLEGTGLDLVAWAGDLARPYRAAGRFQPAPRGRSS
jgi:hypothetical protein